VLKGFWRADIPHFSRGPFRPCASAKRRAGPKRPPHLHLFPKSPVCSVGEFLPDCPVGAR